MDKDALLEICLFQSLVHYVEKEEGLEHWGADWDKEIADGHVDHRGMWMILKARDALLKTLLRLDQGGTGLKIVNNC
jgi:hypothetical protein